MRLPAKRKYFNKPTEVDGYKFASKREANRYEQLKIMQRCRDISDLKADKAELRIPIVINGVKICTYEADFSYLDHATGSYVFEDCKGFKTPVYQIKKKLMKAIHRIEIKEV